MSDAKRMIERVDRASTLAPAGYAVALHIRYMSPTYLLQDYPTSWKEYYSTNSLVLVDPTVAWGFSNEGSCRWSDLTDDPSRVMSRAATHGLKYGIVCATELNGSRSFGSFARSEREFNQSEIVELTDIFKWLHSATCSSNDPSHETIDAVRAMSLICV
jgi:LuxR family transcriptional regulator